MLINLIKSIVEDFKWIPELSLILVTLVLFVKKVRQIFINIFRWAYLWIIFPFKGWEAINAISSDVKILKEVGAKTSEDVTALKQIIGYNGGSGLMDQVGYIAGYQASEFWLRPQPGFICDESGGNLDCTHGYCLLLGLSSKADIVGGGWKSFIDRDPTYGYLEEFKEAAHKGESFRGHVEFFNITGKHLGEWIVVARPISADKAKAKRYMGLMYPSNDLAKEIAAKYGWPLIPPV